MSSNASKKEGFDADSEDFNSVSSKPDDDKQPRRRWSDDISFTTNNVPSSASATVVSTAVARHPTARSGLPTFVSFVADDAAAAAPTVPLKEKKPRRAGFRGQFLQKVSGASTSSPHVLASIQL
jgi:hypothetical protein